MLCKIAGLAVSIGLEESLLHSRFALFQAENTYTQIQYATEFGCPVPPSGAQRVYQSDAIEAYRTGDGWLLKKNNPAALPCAVKASPYWDRALLYRSPESEAYLRSLELTADQEAEAYRLLYLNGLMECFRFSVLPFGRLYAHGVLMDYKGSGLFLSAKSGTGKSTHANFWVKQYGARILDGDNAVLHAGTDRTLAYGLPWCGSSNQFANESVPLAAIVFLEQALENQAFEIDPQQALVRLLQRCFLPAWDEALLSLAMDQCGRVLQLTKAYVLKCRPDDESAEVLKQCLNI